MKRREFIALIGGVAALPIAWPLATGAQDSTRLIGILMGYAERDPAAQADIAVVREALAKLGWTEDRNLRIELRWSEGNPDRIKTFAKELINLRPNAILSHTTAVTDALAREKSTIPIICVIVADPVASGFAQSLARPGGNISGFMVDTAMQGGKWVQLLKEIAPQTSRMALLFSRPLRSPIERG